MDTFLVLVLTGIALCVLMDLALIVYWILTERRRTLNKELNAMIDSRVSDRLDRVFKTGEFRHWLRP